MSAASDDGLVRVKLTRSWGTRRPGAVVAVDPARAARLVKDGLGKAQAPAQKTDPTPSNKGTR